MGNVGKEVDNEVGKILVAIQGIYFLLFGMANSSENLTSNITLWLIAWAVVSPILAMK
jgi:hypothetical protein